MILLAAVQPAADAPLVPVSFEDIAGWADDDHAAALSAFRRSCQDLDGEAIGLNRNPIYGGTKRDWQAVCRSAAVAAHPRQFFEAEFRAYAVSDAGRPQGLFTGYYEPEVPASRVPTAEYNVPLYRRPPDLMAIPATGQDRSSPSYGRKIGAEFQPYFTRREIEEGALRNQGLEIAWLKDWADAFFIHVQGSGRLRFDDGSTMRLAYSAKSGLPYTGIGALLVERGVFPREQMSMQATRRWMDENPAAARELMWENQSFIFFREIELPDPALGALGAQHVQLTPLRSLAVDRRYWPLGLPMWIDTSAPGPTGEADVTFRHLLIAQDTGSAIKGMARGDIYWGAGPEAEWKAGHMKSPGTMIVLLPVSAAQKLNAP